MSVMNTILTKLETLKVSLPKDGGKYYRITVTTHDPESMVNLGAGCNYTYKCKKDKFSDYSVGSATRSGNVSDLL
jgi:hypothetical protein